MTVASHINLLCAERVTKVNVVGVEAYISSSTKTAFPSDPLFDRSFALILHGTGSSYVQSETNPFNVALT